MRIEIGYKFILGFITVIAAVTVIPFVTPYLKIDKDWEHLFSTLCAITVGLIMGLIFLWMKHRLLRKIEEDRLLTEKKFEEARRFNDIAKIV